MKVLGVGHTGICVKNLERSLEFYVGVLGFKILDPPCPMVEDPEEGIALGFPDHSHRVCMIEVKPGQLIELVEFGKPQPTSKEVAPLNQYGKHHISYLVDDIEAWVEKFRSLGLEVNNKPLSYETDVGLEWWAIVKDPDGIEIELVQPAS
jgi:catechol 2,3-dioxygenase-like lactoylglutathione lyase family enzyme